MARTETYLALDALRGVAALSVVLFHADTLLGFVVAPKGYLAVDVFFLMSGVVIAHAYEGRLRTGLSVLRFFALRILRFAPFYYLGLVLGCLFAAASVLLGDQTWDGFGTSVFWGLLFLPDFSQPPGNDMFPLNVPAWSLFYELLINLGYALALPLLSNRFILGIVLASGAALSWVALGTGSGVEFGPLGMHWKETSLRVVFSFGLGVWIYRHKFRATINVWPILALAAIPLFLTPPGWASAWFDLGYVLIVSPLCVAILLGGVAQHQLGGLTKAAFVYLGSISYGIYALHYPLVWLANGLQNRLDVPSGGVVVAYFGVLLGAVYVLEHFIDRPLRRYWARTMVAKKT